MALDPDIRITGTAEESRYDLDGHATREIRVEFFVGKFGPFAERFPKPEFTRDARDQKLNDFARHVRQS